MKDLDKELEKILEDFFTASPKYRTKKNLLGKLPRIKAIILQSIKKEMPLNIPKTLTDDNIPDWLKYGVVCEHDDWTMCGHRANYLITTLEHLLGEGE